MSATMRSAAAAPTGVVVTARPVRRGKINKVCWRFYRCEGAARGGRQTSAPLTGLTKQLEDIPDAFATTRNIL